MVAKGRIFERVYSEQLDTPMCLALPADSAWVSNDIIYNKKLEHLSFVRPRDPSKCPLVLARDQRPVNHRVF